MYINRKISYDPAKGPVTIVVTSGYAPQGSFTLSITDGESMVPVGSGKFGDNLPDIFLLPVTGSSLKRWCLIVIGAYAAAFGHTQISVDYDFYQQGQKIDTELIRDNSQTVSAHHDFNFED